MLAIDTNVIVRYLTLDHPEQSTRTKALVEGNDVFVSATVFLETEWVLRSLYGFEREQTAAALIAFSGLPRVSLEDPPAIAKALAWTASGLDFADALHLAKAQGCEAFVSFDKTFAKLANALSEVKVRAP